MMGIASLHPSYEFTDLAARPGATTSIQAMQTTALHNAAQEAQ